MAVFWHPVINKRKKRDNNFFSSKQNINKYSNLHNLLLIYWIISFMKNSIESYENYYIEVKRIKFVK